MYAYVLHLYADFCLQWVDEFDNFSLKKTEGPTDKPTQTLCDSVPLYNTSICYHFYQYWLQNFTIDCLYLGRNLMTRQRDLAESCT